MKKICGTCTHWNFKVGTDKNWGECLNPDVIAASYVSLTKSVMAVTLATTLSNADLNTLIHQISQNARIYFEENGFGCIHYVRGSDD